jgi:uncharacterized protein
VRIVTPAMSDRKLFVSFKIAEICNLVCPYCYFFFQGDESHREHPTIISADTVKHTGQFLAQGVRDLGISTVEIALHGGEPLLVGKKRFAQFSAILSDTIRPHAKLKLSVQTNGVLLDKEWIELCAANKVGLGISIDGPKHVNDDARFDRRGRGSYDKIVRAIALTKEAQKAGIIPGIGALVVIRPNTSAREIYQHIVHDLDLKNLDFLLPKGNWDNYSPELTSFLEQYSLELLNCWLEDDDPSINIRSLKFIFAPFLTDVGLGCRTNYLADLTEAITIRSNGDVSPDDTLPSLGAAYCNTGHNVQTSSLKAFYNEPMWEDIRRTITHPPDKCAKCDWLGHCGGGEIVTRFSTENKFNNPTIYCKRNQLLYERVREHLLQFVDADVIADRINRSRHLMFGGCDEVPTTPTEVS